MSKRVCTYVCYPPSSIAFGVNAIWIFRRNLNKRVSGRVSVRVSGRVSGACESDVERDDEGDAANRDISPPGL